MTATDNPLGLPAESLDALIEVALDVEERLAAEDATATAHPA